MVVDSTKVFGLLNRKFRRLLLAFFVLCGTVLGFSISNSYLDGFVRLSVGLHATFADRFVTMLLPLSATAIALYIRKPHWFFLMSFIKSIGFSLLLKSVNGIYNAAGWLVCLLFLAGNSLIYFGLIWYWLHYIDGFSESSVTDLIWISIAVAMIILIDGVLVSPFLLSILNS